jgi:hypothetical protein
MIRLAIFVMALLLAVGAVDPTKALLITLAVLSGVELLRFRGPRLWGWRRWERKLWREYDY